MNKIVLFDIDYTLFNTDIFKSSNLQEFKIYDEVKNVLEKLSSVAILGIFSEGEEVLQKKKLLETQIGDHFIKEHMYIVAKKENELEKILETYKNHTIFLIDDKLTILYKAKSTLPHLYTIWVKRGRYAENQEPIEGFVPDSQVDDLTDIVEIIKGK